MTSRAKKWNSLLLAGSLWTSLAIGATTSDSPAPSSAEKTVKLLTVGNSFADDATQLLPKLAEAGGKSLLVRRANLGGHSLEQHAKYLKAYEADPVHLAGRAYTNPATKKKKDWSLREALESEKWDFVTIQQVSSKSFLPETYEPYASELIAYIRKYAPSAEILIHETWAYREDHEMFQKGDGFTQQKMYEELRNAYDELSKRYGLRIIPVGDAFQLARSSEHWRFTYPDKDFDYKNPPRNAIPKQPGSLNKGWIWSKDVETGEITFHLDAKHSNAEGRYLGAAAFYEVLFGNSVADDPYVPPNMNPETARELRKIAHEAVARRQAAKMTQTKG